MRYTKTELALLERAKAHPHGIVSVTTGHRLGRSYGTREYEAAAKLCTRGLLARERVHPYRLPIRGHRGTIGTEFGAEMIYKLVKR